jgi:hypothetical protein
MITQLTLKFPCKYRLDTLDESDESVYDSIAEPVLSREFFFDSKFEYTPAASEEALNNFIGNLDHKSNPFLNLTRKAS